MPQSTIAGALNCVELRGAIEHMTGMEVSMDSIESLWDEFDKDIDGTIDCPEFINKMKYINNPRSRSVRRSVSSDITEHRLHSLSK
jgi:Ca2+-binding EF-hand superfamily protein